MVVETVNAVEKINYLTRRWLVEAWYALDEDPGSSSRSTVLSAAGVWPLLAYLADGADETGRAQLAKAIGVPADAAAEAAREILAVIEQSPASRIALGLWTRRTVELHDAWRDGLAPGVHGALTGDPATDQKHLDAWASDHTGGLVPRLPIRLTTETMFVLASALTVDVTWRQSFAEGRVPSTGPWAGTDGELPVLRCTGWDLEALRVADSPMGLISALTVVGDGDVDVVLMLGAEHMHPADVLSFGTYLAAEDAGVAHSGTPTRSAGRSMPVTFGHELPEGADAPGVTVETADSMMPGDVLAVTTVPFRVRARHNLIDHVDRVDVFGRVDLFGLGHVTTPGSGHFPGISDFPLFVDQAAQDVVAAFTATGFHAAAVTAFGMLAGALPRPSRVKRVSVVFDRPFAYYAVHRPTGLILIAGWVDEPDHEVSSGKA